jgi:hypothetical protein
VINREKTYIASLGLATPPFNVEQTLTGEILEANAGHELSERSLSVMRKLFAHPSINSRCFAFEDSETVFKESSDSRIGSLRDGR